MIPRQQQKQHSDSKRKTILLYFTQVHAKTVKEVTNFENPTFKDSVKFVAW